MRQLTSVTDLVPEHSSSPLFLYTPFRRQHKSKQFQTMISFDTSFMQKPSKCTVKMEQDSIWSVHSFCQNYNCHCQIVSSMSVPVTKLAAFAEITAVPGTSYRMTQCSRGSEVHSIPLNICVLHLEDVYQQKFTYLHSFH